MKKIFLAIFALLTLVVISCDNDPIDITTTPKIRTLTYVINTQSMYDELGITSEITSNYLSKDYTVGVYTFVYDSDENLVTTQSSKESSLGTVTETFQIEEGTYSVVTYVTLVGSGNTPSWTGEDKKSTLTFNDNSSSDFHYILGTIEESIALIGGNTTMTVSPAATRHLLTLNIGTQSMYDTFGVRSSYENVLSNKYNYYVGVTSLIYDKSGQFVDSASTYVKTFQSIQQKFSLRKGNYTILTVETLVDGDNNYTSSWKIDNIQDLSSVVLCTESNVLYWVEIVGTSNCTVSIDNSNHSQDITPTAIGSLIQATAANFDKSDFNFVGFSTKNLPNGYMLSPNAAEKYRYSEYLDPNTYYYRGYFYHEDESFESVETVTFYIFESGRINWGFGPSTVDSEGHIADFYIYPWDAYYTFQDGQFYYAYIRYRGDEKGCDANLGTYDEIKTWVENLEPIVNTDALYAEPYTTWGGSVASVKSYMSAYRIMSDLEKSDDDYVITYYGKYKEDQIRYWFTSQTGGLTNAVVFFDSEKVGEDEILKAFSDMGYELFWSFDSFSWYKTPDGNSDVLFGLNSNNYWYLNYSSASSSLAPKRALKKNLPVFAPKKQSLVKPKIYDKVNIAKQLRQCENMMKLYSK